MVPLTPLAPLAPLASRLADLTADVLLTSVHVDDVTELAPRFLKARISCAAFAHATWIPGDKLQVRPRRGSFTMRTYTPISWDVDDHATELIAYRHGDGPALRWFEDAVNTTGEVFGPSRSLDVSATLADTIFVGDETSVGLAHVVRSINPDARFLFEATDPDVILGVLSALGSVDRTTVVGKHADRGPLLESVLAAAEGCASPSMDLIVTGDAATVSAVRRTMRRHPNLTPRIKARAYWAQGRSGLS